MKKTIVLSIALLLSLGAIQASYRYGDMTGSQIRYAVRDILTDAERANLKQYLTEQIRSTEDETERAEYEALFQSFYKGMYDLVVQEIKTLAKKYEGHELGIQAILKTTGLRARMLEDKPLGKAYFLRDIAELDKVMENMSKEGKNIQEKILHLDQLTDTLARKHMQEDRIQFILDAVNTLKKHLVELQSKTKLRVFKMRIANALERLDEILNERGILE
ncbi:hypothetical protein KC460_03070 [Candidatus Dependentiae bacterium]|nr:hypothetical protein [Candidatus Dependentiae bacterium]